MADLNLLLLLLLVIPISLFALLILIVRPRAVKIPIKNCHVFITGGSNGIGLALAIRAASKGARVSILAHSLGKLEEAKHFIPLSTGVDLAIFAANVRDFESVTKAVVEAAPIDVLVVNQGVFFPQELEKQELDEVRFMIDVNLMGSFNMIKAALPRMKIRDELEKQELDEVRFMIDVNLMGSFNMIKAALPRMKIRDERGPASIALMSSQVGIYGYTTYSASKFRLRGLAKALQQEVIADNMRLLYILSGHCFFFD